MKWYVMRDYNYEGYGYPEAFDTREEAEADLEEQGHGLLLFGEIVTTV